MREVGGRGEKDWWDLCARLYPSQVPPESSHDRLRQALVDGAHSSLHHGLSHPFQTMLLWTEGRWRPVLPERPLGGVWWAVKTDRNPRSVIGRPKDWGRRECRGQGEGPC